MSKTWVWTSSSCSDLRAVKNQFFRMTALSWHRERRWLPQHLACWDLWTLVKNEKKSLRGDDPHQTPHHCCLHERHKARTKSFWDRERVWSLKQRLWNQQNLPGTTSETWSEIRWEKVLYSANESKRGDRERVRILPESKVIMKKTTNLAFPKSLFR
jgi:hypothetical protein